MTVQTPAKPALTWENREMIDLIAWLRAPTTGGLADER